MGLFKKLKKGIIYGGLIGALVGSQYGSISEAYTKVLDADIAQKEAVIDYVRDNKKDFQNKKEYKLRLDKVASEKKEAEERLKNYKSLNEGEQRKEALKDIKHYGLTIENITFDVPNNKQELSGLATGGAYGAGAGATGAILLSALGYRKRKLKEKEGKNAGLEKRIAIFLGLICGGVGISSFSFNLTGNIIADSFHIQNLFGLTCLLIGIVGTYFYFKKN